MFRQSGSWREGGDPGFRLERVGHCLRERLRLLCRRALPNAYDDQVERDTDNLETLNIRVHVNTYTVWPRWR